MMKKQRKKDTDVTPIREGQMPELSDRKNKKHRHWPRVVLTVLILLPVVLALTAFGVYHTLRISGKNELSKNANHIAPVMNRDIPGEGQQEENNDPALCYYQGKAYRYNENTINILCIGIDKFTETIETVEEGAGGGGQADAIFLVSLDPDRNKVDIYAISRDTMTPIKNFDAGGNYVGEDVNHLALAYSYGDGAHTSSKMTEEAVSGLFYQLPIHGYLAVNLQAIAKLNDAVGGVVVTVPEELEKEDNSFTGGERLMLTGEQAMNFVRKRNMESVDGNDLRMERQKQYVSGFLDSAKKAVRKDLGLPYQLYQELAAQMVTNLKVNHAVYLAGILLKSGFKMEDIQRLPGTTKKGVFYSEFHVDEDGMYELMLRNFYTEIQE